MDGNLEVMNRIVVQLLRDYYGKHPTSWDEHIEYIQHSYNRIIHSSINKSPFETYLVIHHLPLWIVYLDSKRIKEIHLRKRKRKLKILLKRLGKFI